MIHQLYELAQRQSLPLESKVRLSLMRINAWVIRFDESITISLKGCKEELACTIITSLVKDIIPDVEVGEGKYPITPFRVGNNPERTQNWLEYSCNSYEGSLVACRPLSVWTLEDLENYSNRLEKG